MEKRWVFIVMVVALMLGLVGVSSAAGGSTTFGTTTNMSKIGDAWGHPVYGGGLHSIRVSGDEIYAVFTYRNVYGDIEVKVARSNNLGEKWEGNQVVAYGDIDSDGARLGIGPDPTDPNKIALHVAWSEYDAANGIWSIRYSRGIKNYSGQYINWSAPKTISGLQDVEPWVFSLDADPLGGVHVVYGLQSNPRDAYYVGSIDHGDNFGTPYYIGSGGNMEPSIASDSQGNVFIAWGDTGSGTYITKRVNSAWSTVRVNGLYSPGWAETSIAVYSANDLYIAWRTSDGIVVATTHNGGATENDWTQEFAVTKSGTPYLDYASIAVDANNAPRIAYLDLSNVLFVQYAANKWSTPVMVADDGYTPNLAIDDNGKANIMFADGSEKAVYFNKEQ